MMTKRGHEYLSAHGNGASAVNHLAGTSAHELYPYKYEVGDNFSNSSSGSEANNKYYHHQRRNYHQSATSFMADPIGTKKLKLDEAGNSSTVNGSGHQHPAPPDQVRVVHIRNIPPETTSVDLQILANQFGRMTKHLLVKSKGQAFIEFETYQMAYAMANFWMQTTSSGVPAEYQPTIRGRHIHVQLSNHKELKATSKDDANGGGHGSNGVVDHIAPPKVDDIDQNDDRIGGFNAVKNDPSPVIRVVIENMIYQVTIDTLYAVFSRCGVVQKIILFTKNNSFQALVQFADISSAIKARQVMNGQTMYAGANLLRVDYSKLINLNIKFQNDKSRDFTLMGPPTNVIGAPVMSGGGGGGGGHGNNNGGQYGNGEGGNPDEAMLAQQFGIYGHAALRGANAHPYANVAALQALQSASSLANGGLLSPAPLSIAQMPNAGNVGGVPISRVILVSGLAPEMTPDALFTLFGVYGDVQRVKILFNKKDTALIQMNEPSQALLAVNHLDKIRLYGRSIRVMPSKHQGVQMPKDGQQDSGLTRDYQNSPLHRFKRPGSKNFNNIYPPSETLHVSNIPHTLSEEDLKEAFNKETDKAISKFKFFPNDRKMALVQYESISDALVALIKMHNFKVGEHSHLRVSFSKSPV